jgi:hypothetical protein
MEKLFKFIYNVLTVSVVILFMGYTIFQETSKIGGIIVCIIALIFFIFEVISFISNDKSE